jgi:hypothetical protein
MTHGIDQDNDYEDMRCPRLGCYCKDFDKCRTKILPETTGSCRVQREAQAHALCTHMQTLCANEPVNEPMSEKNLFLVRVRDRLVASTTKDTTVQAVADTVRDALDVINSLEKRLDAKNPSLDVKNPDGYKCEVRDCGSNVSGWCQWFTDLATQLRHSSCDRLKAFCLLSSC